eukprot:14646766-Alexandrium_andersonii.AAC.1
MPRGAALAEVAAVPHGYFLHVPDEQTVRQDVCVRVAAVESCTLRAGRLGRGPVGQNVTPHVGLLSTSALPSARAIGTRPPSGRRLAVPQGMPPGACLGTLSGAR